MKLKKTTASLLTMTLLSTFALALLPQIVTAPAAEIVWLTHWTEPEEVAYWDSVIQEYNAVHDPDIRQDRVEFDALYETIMVRHAAGEDPDIIHMHAMWVPTFANDKTKILAIPPSDVQAEVKVPDWTPATVDGVTYKSIRWGYPSEFNSWALVYNRKLFQDAIAAGKTALTPILANLEADTPLSYSELRDAAKLLTEWDTSVSPKVCTQTGFVPFIEGMPEEQRFQFLSLLYSNGGDYVDFEAPEALFDSTSGYEVMQLYHNLGFVDETYNRMSLPDYWYSAWADQTIAMMILPTWMTYVRGAMGANFGNLGIAPIPKGPSGTQSVSMTYNWLNVVTEKTRERGTYNAAWDFLRWINAPRAKGTVAGKPRGTLPGQVSLMGDYLIFDSIIPSRKSDQDNGETTPGTLMKADFWFSEFIKFGTATGSAYVSRADKAFVKAEQAQYEIGLMFERVTVSGDDPVTAVNDAANAIDGILPMAGDINLDGPVNVGDAVLYVRDFWALPGESNWNRGRSDIDDDGQVMLKDGGIIVRNYGRVGDP